MAGGKWDDEEERRFFEDIQDLRDFVPKSVLGLDEAEASNATEGASNKLKEEELEKERKDQEETEAKELEKELKRLELQDESQEKAPVNRKVTDTGMDEDEYGPALFCFDKFELIDFL